MEILKRILFVALLISGVNKAQAQTNAVLQKAFHNSYVNEYSYKTKNPLSFTKRINMWYQLESNQRHKDFQSFALPTELWYLLLGVANVVRFLAF